MSVTISTLPTEILSSVIQYAGDDSRSAVITCMLINQLWHDTSRPMLYTDLVLSCGKSLGRFIACHNQQALSLTRSFTLYLNHDNQSDRLEKGIWDRTELLIPQVANIMRSMLDLHSFSLIRHHRTVRDPSHPWPESELYKPTRSNISALLNSLPASCISLEVAVRDTKGGPEQTHVCDDLRRVLPRMHHVRINLDPMCDKMLGTWDKDNIFHPISLPNLQTLHLDCLKDNEWADRRRVQPLTIWHSLVPALQQVATLPDTPSSARITALGVSRSGPDDKSIHRTFLRCNIKKEARDTKTWAFPVTDLLGLNSSPAYYIRMRDGESYVILDSRDIITIAGGQPWRTLATGTRLPTAWTRGKVLMPDHGIFEYTEWTTTYPRNHPMLIQNERISGQCLIDAEEREGYLNTESLIEKTPKGFVRYGGPVWRNWRLYAEDDYGPDGLTPDAPNATVGRD